MKACIQGFFNPLHPGHLRLFEYATIFGDLIVIINRDTEYKKEDYITQQQDRLEIIKSIKYVSHAVLSIDEGKCETLRMLRPDYYIQGGDHKTDIDFQVVNACDEIGCRLIIAPRFGYWSSTKERSCYGLGK